MADPDLKQKLEGLISENPVLLLMKGTPEAPGCGNSMRALQAIGPYGVEYAALDVLPVLEPLREVTGEIADWRTFPQLYVNGELVGGADLIEEMHASGELGELLGAEVADGDSSADQTSPGHEADGAAADRALTQSPPMQIENS